MIMRRFIPLLLLGLLLPLTPGCDFRSASPTHQMSFSIPLYIYDQAVQKVIHLPNGGKLLPAALEKARKDCEAEYAVVVRLVDEWARGEQFRRIPAASIPTHQPRFLPDVPVGMVAVYEEQTPANPQWPIQLVVYPSYEGGGQMIALHILADEGRSPQPSQRFIHAHATLSEALRQRYGNTIGASLK